MISLLVLLVLGIIAATVARTSQLQLHMAGNEETRVAALQQALALVDGVLSAAVRTPATGGVGYRWCAAGSPDETCDERTIEVDPGVEPAAGSLDAAVVRVAPEAGRLPVMGEGKASSTVHYRVAKLEVQVVYDGTNLGLGRSVLAQGVLVRLPASPQSGGGNQ